MDDPLQSSWRPIFGLLALILLLAGCSSTTMAYRYADWGIVWWVEDYITLTSEQKSRLNSDLEDLRQWHCTAELPRYQSWLADLTSGLSAGPPSPDDVQSHQQQALAFIPELLTRATPIATRLLASLDHEQVQELARNMQEKQQELEQELLQGSRAEAAQARAERAAERLERWLGDLNTEQRDIINDWSANRGQQTEIWLQSRRNWQLALLDALEFRQAPEFGNRIEELLLHSERYRGKEYRAMMAESQSAMAALIHSVINAGDREHRNHLLAKASELRGDFASLTCS